MKHSAKIQLSSSARLINIAARMFSDQLQNLLKHEDIELTIEQWRLLFYLWIEDDINQQELARRAKKEKSTITRIVNSLEHKGFIKRENRVNDRRNKNIKLTEKGRFLEPVTIAIADQVVKNAEAGIEAKDLKVFSSVLTKLISNLDQKFDSMI